MRALSPRDVLRPVPLLVRAFDDDPFFNYLAPRASFRRALLAEVMRSFLELSGGHVRVAFEIVRTTRVGASLPLWTMRRAPRSARQRARAGLS